MSLLTKRRETISCYPVRCGETWISSLVVRKFIDSYAVTKSIGQRSDLCPLAKLFLNSAYVVYHYLPEILSE